MRGFFATGAAIVVGTLLLNLALLAGAVFVVVWVLQKMGVI